MAKENSEILGSYSGKRWKSIGVYKRAGVAVPLFFMHSKDSIGIGDLADIKLLAEWCAKAGFSIAQFLPMNEVGSVCCPYDSISSFAIEPMYISLSGICGSDKAPVSKKIALLKKSFSKHAGYVDYRIKGEKMRVLWDIFCAEDANSGNDFQKFVKENFYWIDDFAMYKIIKETHEGKPWYEWPDELKERDSSAIKSFSEKHEKSIRFHKWVQWQLFKQFKEAKAYASSRNVLLKGDLPILVSRDSADVWAHPELFKLEYAAGAPPDMYCAKGQRWGMPTQNWDAEGTYEYVREKLKYAQNFYSILRVDHVVGLFRIWSIPYNEPQDSAGLNGFFDPKEEALWHKNGKDKLTFLLDNTGMLLAAEDLGMIPKDCPSTLKELGILGNDVQRWVKDWTVKHDFFDPERYRHLSVAMLSTHDTTNWAAWWESEAGTVDEATFVRKCVERGIDYNSVRGKLFDSERSCHGRLRWLDSVDSTDFYISILGKRREELADFIDMYENTYKEKEKLWKKMKLKGPVREKCDSEILKAALKITLYSASVFCIELITDIIYLTGLLKGDPYQYRINTPGTVNNKNWSLVSPISLEDMMDHKVTKEVKAILKSSKRTAE